MRSTRAALAALLAAAGCAPRPAAAPCTWDGAAPPAQQAGHDGGSPPKPPAEDLQGKAEAGGYHYRVAASPGAEQLCVEVELPRDAPASRVWSVDARIRPFLKDVAVRRGGALAPAASEAGGWLVPACGGSACRLRYRVLLADAARQLEDLDRAVSWGGALLSPPSTWLLRPRDVKAPFLLTVSSAAGDSFLSGLALAPEHGTAFRGEVGALDETPYAAFGRFPLARKRIGGGLVDVAFFHAEPTPAVQTWIDRSLEAVAAYYQRFPIDHLALAVRIVSGRGVTGGHTMGDGGATVLISAGEQTDAAGFRNDWMLVHELVHVSFPDTFTPWAEEGLATYVEPIIRYRSGLCDADEIWRSLVEGLPHGQPEPGDGGLDVTDTWGRRYWGGAMFWLLGDIEIRKRTGNGRSLDDALLAVNRAGGNVSQRWELERVLAMVDDAIGAEVFRPLRRQMGKSPVRVDLAALWKSLGVAQVDGKMVYDDSAPLASVRQGILSGKPPPAK